MSCQDVQKFVYVYLDGEFDAREQAEWDAHLAQCPACARLVAAERAFRTLLQASLRERPVRAPASLVQAVRARLDEAAGGARQRTRRIFVWGPALAAAAALTVFVAVRAAGPRAPDFAPPELRADTVAPLVDGAAEVHHRGLPAEVEGPETVLASNLGAKVPFRPVPPLPASTGARLLGARVVRVDGQPGIQFLYEYHGRRVSVVQLAPAPSGPGSPQLAGAPVTPRLTESRGYNVALFSDHGLTNSVVSDIDQTELLRILPATYRR